MLGFPVLLSRAAQHSSHPYQDLTQGERLGDIVIGTEIKAGDGIVLRVFCSQEDNRNFAFSFFAKANPDIPPIMTSSKSKSNEVKSNSKASSAELAVSTS